MAIIDTRDLEKELQELLEASDCSACGGTGEKGDDECEKCGGTGHPEEADDMPDDDPDKERASDIEAAREEISEWEFGEQLIPDDEFEDYARQLAEDIGAISSDAQWPLSYIDWSRAADALRMDYSPITIGDDEYLYRA
jgi:hypothetical protein